MPSRSVLLNRENSCGKIKRENRRVNEVEYVESIADKIVLVIAAVKPHKELDAEVD